MSTSIAEAHRVSISTGTVDPDWDHFVEQTPGGHHAQTSLWGQLKCNLGGKSARVIVSREDGETIGGAQLVMRPLPLGAAVAYVPKGPVLAPKVAGDPEMLQLVIDEIHQLARQEHAQCLVVQPPDNGCQIAGQIAEWGFQASQLQVQACATMRIDLSQDLDTILSRVKKKTRERIRRSLRSDLTFREGGREDLPAFYQVFKGTAERQGFPPVSYELFTQMWDLFSPQGRIKLFICEYEGEVVCARTVIPFGDMVVGKHTGWSGEHAKKSPNQFLDWKILEWAKEHGYRYFDFDGIDYDIARSIVDDGAKLDPDVHGQAYYKLSFGGDIHIFPLAHYYVYNPVLRAGYKLIADRLATNRRFLSGLNRLRAG